MISSISDYSSVVAYPIAQSSEGFSKKDQGVEGSFAEPSSISKSTDSDVTISAEAKELSQSEKDSSKDENSLSNEKLSEEELKQIQSLKSRDQEVRTHEQAHQSAAGSLSNGGASFEYQTGPDGHRYAVGGEVSIDTSKVPNDPQATIAKARQIRRAALAPANPSGQDRQVAAQSVKMEAEANKELASQRMENSSATSLENSSQSSSEPFSSEQSPSEQPLGGTSSAADSTSKNSVKTDFYQQIQSSISKNDISGQGISALSRLDYYA